MWSKRSNYVSIAGVVLSSIKRLATRHEGRRCGVQAIFCLPYMLSDLDGFTEYGCVHVRVYVMCVWLCWCECTLCHIYDYKYCWFYFIYTYIYYIDVYNSPFCCCCFIPFHFSFIFITFYITAFNFHMRAKKKIHTRTMIPICESFRMSCICACRMCCIIAINNERTITKPNLGLKLFALFRFCF